MRRGIAVVALTVAPGACSLVTDIGATGAPTNADADAATDVAGGDEKAPDDAAIADAFAPGDGGALDASDSSDAWSSWCSSQGPHLFCADFDGSAALGASLPLTDATAPINGATFNLGVPPISVEDKVFRYDNVVCDLL